MSHARLKTPNSGTDIYLDHLDRLIAGYLSTLLERTGDVKLSDFTKLVELRHRISPADNPARQDWHSIESGRTEKLSKPPVVQNGEEEPPA